MSLEEKPRIDQAAEEPEQQKTEKKQSKKARARKIALENKTLNDHQLRQKIVEEVPCHRSTASKAVTWLRKHQLKEKKFQPEKPQIKVLPEEKKSPEFIEEPKKESPIEEIAVEQTHAEETITPEKQQDLDIFQEMLRSLHVLIFAKGGIIDMLVKAGVSERLARDVADQLYRWLARRYTVENLQRMDTILLIASYGTLIGSIVAQVMGKKKKEDKPKAEKTKK